MSTKISSVAANLTVEIWWTNEDLGPASLYNAILETLSKEGGVIDEAQIVVMQGSTKGERLGQVDVFVHTDLHDEEPPATPGEPQISDSELLAKGTTAFIKQVDKSSEGH